MNGWLQLPGRWVAEGVCGQTDPEEFFPDKHELGRTAKQLCRSCPVQLECLTFALDNKEMYGVWGGFTVNERKNMRLRERISAADAITRQHQQTRGA